MKIATGASIHQNSAEAVREVARAVRSTLGQAPANWVLVQATVTHDFSAIREAVRAEFPTAAIHGGSSCGGTMTERGLHSDGQTALSIFAIADEGGAFGVGVETLGDDPAATAKSAVTKAIAAAGRAGEAPALVWIGGAPGGEEAVLRGIVEELGDAVLVAGGSTGDNTVSGQWKQFGEAGVWSDALVVSALFPSGEVVSAFHSGYSPTAHRGTVTESTGRQLVKIAGRPAAEVYNEWTGGALADYMKGGHVLAATSMQPLGVVVGERNGVEDFRLIHPERVLPDGSLTLFADAHAGTEVVLMQGTIAALAERAAAVAQMAVEVGGFRAEDTAGALVVYCAGCMLALGEDATAIAPGISRQLAGRPFMGYFTFGEQGRLAAGNHCHGNLMISVTAFINP